MRILEPRLDPVEVVEPELVCPWCGSHMANWYVEKDGEYIACEDCFDGEDEDVHFVPWYHVDAEDLSERYF